MITVQLFTRFLDQLTISTSIWDSPDEDLHVPRAGGLRTMRVAHREVQFSVLAGGRVRSAHSC